MNKRNTIAIIYDFDGTLSPQPMQEYTVFPQLNIKPSKFWGSVKKENAKVKGEEIITYMMLMLKKANDDGLKITKSDLGKMASGIEFYKGVETFFTRINNFVAKESKNHVKGEALYYFFGLERNTRQNQNKEILS